jgi:hypothetical protein
MFKWKQQLEAEAKTSSRKFQSIFSGPISQLQQTPSLPPAPPGLTKPTINLQCSSATIADNNKSESSKKHCIEDAEEGEVSQIVEVEMAMETGPDEPVHPTNPLTLNPLIAAYDNIPVSVMTTKTCIT